MRASFLLFPLALAACGGGLSSQLCGDPGQPCCEASTCKAGATCNASNQCEACGATGQSCCPGDAPCASGNRCDGSNVCLPCGAKSQACCAGDACEQGLTCSAGTCGEMVTCMTNCTLGATRCASGGIEHCVTGGVCPEWRVLVAACPGGTSCMTSASGAECVEACPGACTVDALLCTVEGFKRCTSMGGGCPSLVTEPDDPDRPQCVTGGVVGADIVWESPTPLGVPLAAIAGDLVGSYWVLDALGNVVHNALGSWEYEVRPTAGKRALALTSCNLGSRLVAVGEGGTVYRRGFGTWTEENVGDASVTLTAVACDSSQRVYATGSNGKLYIRDGTWRTVNTGAAGRMNGLTLSFAQQRVYLVGAGGAVINCNLASMPVTCAAETSNTTNDLFAAWADTFSNTVFAVGAGGTFLMRGASWTALDSVGTTQTLRAVHGWYDSANSRVNVVTVGDQGVYLAIPVLSVFKNVVAAEDLTGVMVIDKDNVFVTSRAGKIWYANTISPLPAIGFTARGGAKPVSKSLRGVAGIGPGRLLAVGDDGTRVKRESGAWLPDGVGAQTTQVLYGIAARGPGEAYAVGGAGTVLVRRYGTWSDDAAGVTAKTLRAVTLDSERVVAVGDDGEWLEKTAASAWTRVTSMTSARLDAVAMRVDAQGKALETVAVGADCTVLSRTGTGAVTVVPVTACPAGTELLAARFSPSGELTIAGTGAVVLKRTTSGFQREYLDSTTLENVKALVFQGTTAWALLEQGKLFRKAGASWARFASDVAVADLNAAYSDTAEGLFIVGSSGLVWRKP